MDLSLRRHVASDSQILPDGRNCSRARILHGNGSPNWPFTVIVYSQINVETWRQGHNREQIVSPRPGTIYRRQDQKSLQLALSRHGEGLTLVQLLTIAWSSQSKRRQSEPLPLEMDR